MKKYTYCTVNNTAQSLPKPGIFLLILFSLAVVSCSQKEENSLLLTVDDYEAKVYASWLGQMVGNIYGLVHENMYIDEPGPDTFPYGYDYKPIPFFNGKFATEYFEENQGAFSDDDTDIEYMYVLQMEKHGIEPTYQQLADAWKHHIRGWVWVANRAALRLMHYGHYPPLTGNKGHNPHWFQIDPQLVNEIWAITAPGMIEYACDKTNWSAHITNDSIGTEPTIFYAAMYSAAFFSNNIDTLLSAGIRGLGENRYFSNVAKEMIALHKRFPNDWKEARKHLKEKYYDGLQAPYKSVYNATLNGACSILALLYGNGDFQRTLDLCCAMGWDADNQAATISGLLALANGLQAIPEDLLYPLESWEQPFNDTYINRTRHDLPDASILDIAQRTAALGEKVILANGGRLEEVGGTPCYEINPLANFHPALEIHPAPLILFHKGRPSSYKVNYSHNSGALTWRILDGELPKGITFRKGRFEGAPEESGEYELLLEARSKEERVQQSYTLHILERNLAAEAKQIRVFPVSKARGSVTECERAVPSIDPEVLRDRITRDQFYSSYNPNYASAEKISFEYHWDQYKDISQLIYYTGWMEQHGGWFTSFGIDYLDPDGYWVPVSSLMQLPAPDFTNMPFSRAHYMPYLCKFNSVTTKGIRISGKAAGRTAWNHPAVVHFVNLSEIAIY